MLLGMNGTTRNRTLNNGSVTVKQQKMDPWFISNMALRLSPWTQARLLVLTVLAIHLLVAPWVSLGVDEAHYALYALHPALSYFDHPPMVGWLQMLVAPLGYNELTLRLVPSFIYALISLQAYRITWLLYPGGSRWQGLVAVLLLNSAPILQLMGWGLVPDLPLMLIALLVVERAWLLAHRHEYRDGVWLGLLLGMAGLCKYTAIFLPLGLVLFLLGIQGRKCLRSGPLWIAALLALVLILPVLIWNYQHDWASFEYQLGHAQVDAWQWRDLAAMQLFQLLCYSILVYVGGVAATVSAIFRSTGCVLARSDGLLIAMAWPFLLVTSWSAAHGEILPNWPALGWTLLAPLTAHWVCRQWHRLWVKSLAMVSGLVSLPLIAFLVLFLAFKPLSLFPFMKPLIKDLVGWEQVAEKAVSLHRSLPEGAVLLVENWSWASRIAWYAQGVPVQILGEKATQFDYWNGRPDDRTVGLLIRDSSEHSEQSDIQTGGLECRYVDHLDTGLEGVPVNHFDFYYCRPAS